MLGFRQSYFSNIAFKGGRCYMKSKETGDVIEQGLQGYKSRRGDCPGNDLWYLYRSTASLKVPWLTVSFKLHMLTLLFCRNVQGFVPKIQSAKPSCYTTRRNVIQSQNPALELTWQIHWMFSMTRSMSSNSKAQMPQLLSKCTLQQDLP